MLGYHASKVTKQNNLMLFTKLIVCFALLTLTSGCIQGQNCHLPDCYCTGHNGPMQIRTKETPQIVMISFDDAVNEQNMPFYQKLFSKKRKNPNGCSIKGTFFVSHNWTDYKMVKQLHELGHEIAVHSVTHRLPHSWWKTVTLL